VVGVGVRKAFGAAGEQPPAKIKGALYATERMGCSTDRKKPALSMAAAEKAESGYGGSCTGLAAFFSGGSLVAARCACSVRGRVSCCESGFGRGVFAAVAKSPRGRPESFRKLCRTGCEVTNRVQLWAQIKERPLWECGLEITDMHVFRW